ncbi:MAG: hypothetical protein MRQ05_01775 [Candidatus Midichloria mitochondrii]|uniref:hypothetical protein n=1 Tax=Candidatus Midichloria mitochondrii TaxID=234827 RepID=UPI00030C7593|nr:hypothetical protein [Candidatus Midichloria mitochondrii]MDJ1256576.1 hypothetical protein [Candidatus Midichloria mitochondrii]MDJ1288297.1 hypothetical protein [Candidatus Midichloria mitochondrii]MDJ1299161.1 hypothetical protein [Candidatus Midichloria mitochondrii]MDJ1312848.1 hypothetical protein [Candidatus Midichloria mitochondrii]
MCRDIKQDRIYQAEYYDLLATYKPFVIYLDKQDAASLEIKMEEIEDLICSKPN